VRPHPAVLGQPGRVWPRSRCRSNTRATPRSALPLLVDEIYARMTVRTQSGHTARRCCDRRAPAEVSTNLLAGLMESLASEAYRGHATCGAGGALRWRSTNCSRCGIAADARLRRTGQRRRPPDPLGKEFAEADTQARKRTSPSSWWRASRWPRTPQRARRAPRPPCAAGALPLRAGGLPQRQRRRTDLARRHQLGSYAELYTYDDAAESFSLEFPDADERLTDGIFRRGD